MTNRILVVLALVMSIILVLGTGCATTVTEEQKDERTKEQLSEIEQLIQQLGNDNWETREKAQKELIKTGNQVIPLLEKTITETKDPEIKLRCQFIIKELTILRQDTNGNFILYVSNQSIVIKLVDIKIYIDEKLAVDGNFDVGNCHNWKEFQFDMEEGLHKLRVESIKGSATLETEFVIKDKHWAVIDYWSGSGNPTKFTFHIQDNPIMFL